MTSLPEVVLWYVPYYHVDTIYHLIYFRSMTSILAGHFLTLLKQTKFQMANFPGVHEVFWIFLPLTRKKKGGKGYMETSAVLSRDSSPLLVWWILCSKTQDLLPGLISWAWRLLSVMDDFRHPATVALVMPFSDEGLHKLAFLCFLRFWIAVMYYLRILTG